MKIDPVLLEILRLPGVPRRARPATTADLPGCGLVYPVRDDIPVLLVDEARRPG